MLDQEYGLMKRMRSAVNVYRTLDRMRNMNGAEIHRLTNAERVLIRRLREGGYLG